MMMPEALRGFAQEAPIALMARASLERILTPAKLDEWFDGVAQRQYTRELMFSTVFEVMSLVACKVFPTIHGAYQRLGGKVGVSITSLYNKLNAMEPQTSRALVRDTAGEMARAIVDLKGDRAPWIPGYRVKVLDGNCIEATEHRLKVVRNSSAGPLPGKSLVVFDPALEMVIDLIPCEDGHAQERSLLPEVAPTVEQGDLWIMDRNFCVRDFLRQIEQRGGRFICRRHEGLPLTALSPERFVGATETGMVYERWVSIDGATAGESNRYRLIRVRLKHNSRDGDSEIFILTDLSKTAANGKFIAELYRRRWTIETLFQQLERHLNSEVNSLGYPKAALFAFCTALVAHNAFAVIKAALRRARGEEAVEMLSGYYVSIELTQTHWGMSIAVPPDTWSRLARATHAEFLDLLLQIARGANLLWYRKHPRGPKKPQPERTEHAGKTHVSTARLLRDSKKTGN